MRVLLLETLVLPAPPSGTITYPRGAHTNVDDEVGAAWINEGKAAPDVFESLAEHAAYVAQIAALEAAEAAELAAFEAALLADVAIEEPIPETEFEDIPVKVE